MKKILFVLAILSSSAFAQQFSSETVCKAQTPCYNAYGQFITTAYCQVYGGSAVSNGASNNACSWYVSPNNGVQCEGYVKVRNNAGQAVWAWQTFSAQCPR